MKKQTPARVVWDETSRTLKNLDFDDIYFQTDLGLDESNYVFVQHNGLPERFKTANIFRIAELGFGSGLNFLLTWKLWLEQAPANAHLHYFSIEKHPLPSDALRRIYAFWPELSALSKTLVENLPPPFAGRHSLLLSPGNVTLTLHYGEASGVLEKLNTKIDVWYLDGFAPAKNPAMWEEGLFKKIADNTANGGTFATFTAAGHVRRGLESAGFAVRKEKGFGKKRDMLSGSFHGKNAAKDASRKKVIVLGAGIAGCSAAYALARRGHDVVLVDRSPAPAQETSGNPAGIIYPKLTAAASPAGEIYLHSFLFTRRLLQALPDAGFTPCGSLHLALDDEEDARQRKIVALADDPDFVRQLNALAASETAGISLDQPALYFPSAGFVRPPDFCQSLMNRPNIKAIFGTSIAKTQRNAGLWEVFDEKDRLIAGAPLLVIATGTGIKNFMPETKLEYLKGQVTFLTATAETRKLKTVLCHDGYLTPPMDGMHYTGATFDKVKNAEDFTVSETDHARNLEKLHKNIPAMQPAATPAGGRVGYRVAAHDRLPVAGPIPGQDGLFVLGALGSHGLTTAPLLGELLTCQITGDPLPLDPSLLKHLDPSKFR